MSKRDVMEKALKAQKKLDKIDEKEKSALDLVKQKAAFARLKVLDDLDQVTRDYLESVSVA